jgi:hypothetical protein
MFSATLFIAAIASKSSFCKLFERNAIKNPHLSLGKGED